MRRWPPRSAERAAAARLTIAALLALAGAAAIGACGARQTTTTAAGTVAEPVPRPRAQRAARVVRVLLATTARREVAIGAEGGEWRIYDAGGRTMVARGTPGRTWRVQPAGGRLLRAVRDDGLDGPAREGPFLARPVDERTLLTFNGKRWRGDLVVVPTDSGLLVVNHLGVEDYLRGVVPLEMGRRTDAERAALEAQAVASRSYVYVRALGDPRRSWDVVGTVTDQVYGGADAEQPVSDLAIRATSGEVLWANGRPVSAPFHAVCGGSTAAPDEVWKGTSPEPHLRSVSDRDPATGRSWCEPSPRYRWSRTFEAAALEASLARWLRAQGSGAAPGRVRAVRVDRVTPSGRVGTLAIEADGGRLDLRGNDIRYVLRGPSGDILASTYFSVEPTIGRDGRVASLTLRGTGYGHGVGMCQWGAIGRARAGQDYRRILQAYYPGAGIQRVD